MSDNPTFLPGAVWVVSEEYDNPDTVGFVDLGRTLALGMKPAERADVLAALPDKWWYHDGVYDNPKCSPDEPCHVAGVPHPGCHWAVKP